MHARQPRKLHLPKRHTAAFVRQAISSQNRIVDLGFASGEWIKHAGELNPRARIHGVEHPDLNRREIPGAHLSYTGFKAWLKDPRKFGFINAGIFIHNYLEELVEEIEKEIRRSLKKRDKAVQHLRNTGATVGDFERALIKTAGRQAEEQLVKDLRRMRERKLLKNGVLRVVEWGSSTKSTIDYLTKAGFTKISWRRIPKTEFVSATEKEYLNPVGDFWDRGNPIEIIAI